MNGRSFFLLLFKVLVSLGIGQLGWADSNQRIGLEIELALHDDEGQVFETLGDSRFIEKRKAVLSYLKKIYGGQIQKQDNGFPYLSTPHSPSAFRVDSEWVGQGGRDGLEVVTPPLFDPGLRHLSHHFDEFTHTLKLGPGFKASMQFNIELRNLIPGFELGESPPQKMGVSYQDIRHANISKVVDLLLFLELNLVEIYTAFSPQRLGYLINRFSVPLFFEHKSLLVELAEMPENMRTYENVRKVFLNHYEREKTLTDYGDRTSWKYRSFNLEKFLKITSKSPKWVYPALEIRIPDSPESGEELDRALDLVFALAKEGPKHSPTPEEVRDSHLDFVRFWDANKDKINFFQLTTYIGNDILHQSRSPEFIGSFRSFIKTLGLSPKIYKPSHTTSFISQSHGVYKLIGETTIETTIDGNRVRKPLVTVPWDIDGITFGQEFEYKDRGGYAETMEAKGFLEEGISTESASGNKEVRTKPFEDIHEAISAVYHMREVLGEDLRSIHFRIRLPKEIYETIPKKEFDAWLARIGDWVVGVRALYRNSSFAFNTRTQNRSRVDSPNAWIEPDMMEYRGTMRTLPVGDHVDIEIRGLMDGYYKSHPLHPDLLLTTVLLVLSGLREPHLVHGFYHQRLVNEIIDPQKSMLETMTRYLKNKNATTEDLSGKINLLLKSVRVPDLMLLPLMGFEYLPFLTKHEVYRLTFATQIWARNVMKILRDGDLESDEAKKKFRETLSTWIKDSLFQRTLFNSLLGSVDETASWATRNLPRPPLRAEYLRKLVSIQKGEHANDSIDLFLGMWKSKDSKSFYTAAKEMEGEDRGALAHRLEPTMTKRQHKTLVTKLEVSPSEPKAKNALPPRSNMKILLGEPPQAANAPPPEEAPREAPLPPAREETSQTAPASTREAAPQTAPVPSREEAPPATDSRTLLEHVSRLDRLDRESTQFGRPGSLLKQIDAINAAADPETTAKAVLKIFEILFEQEQKVPHKRDSQNNLMEVRFTQALDVELHKVLMEKGWSKILPVHKVYTMQILSEKFEQKLKWTTDESPFITFVDQIMKNPDEGIGYKDLEVVRRLLIQFIVRESLWSYGLPIEVNGVMSQLNRLSEHPRYWIRELAQQIGSRPVCHKWQRWKYLRNLVTNNVPDDHRNWVMEPAVRGLIEHYKTVRNRYGFRRASEHLPEITLFINQDQAHQYGITQDILEARLVIPRNCRTGLSVN